MNVKNSYTVKDEVDCDSVSEEHAAEEEKRQDVNKLRQ